MADTPGGLINPVAVESTLQSIMAAKRLAMGVLALMVWDYALTIQQEVRCFWRGGWDVTRILFILNRYLLAPNVVLLVVYFNMKDADVSPNFCTRTIKCVGLLSIITTILVQYIMANRVYHMFSSSVPIRGFLIIALAASTALTAYFLVGSVRDIHITQSPFYISGCVVSQPFKLWRGFIPCLVMHTVLYALTVLRAVRARQPLSKAPVMQRMLKEGSWFYLAIIVSVGITTAGAIFQEETGLISPLAILSNSAISISAILANRVMLSIQSLAVDFQADTPWLLNHVELSRVQWRVGSRPGEIIVDVDARLDDEYIGFDPVQSRVGVFHPE